MEFLGLLNGVQEIVKACHGLSRFNPLQCELKSRRLQDDKANMGLKIHHIGIRAPILIKVPPPAGESSLSTMAAISHDAKEADKANGP